MRIAPLGLSSLAAALATLRPNDAAARDVVEVVEALLDAVRTRGDAALVEATSRLDWPGATASTLRVGENDLRSAYEATDPRLREALALARDNCSWFHRHELRAGWEETGPQGQRLGIRYLPVERAGLYVPGGRGAYASSVIMNAVPAVVAGVGSLFVCTPPDRDGAVNESVLAAAHLMGIREVYRVGGAQSVGAMAYGTETIRRADVICGPGNAYVTEAKRQVFGVVGIDGLAGPSEVVIVADETAEPRLVAADMCAQEEHGSGASAVLVAATEGLSRAVEVEARALRGSSLTPRAVGASGLYAFYPEPGEQFTILAKTFVNAYAPEHLELHLQDARGFLKEVDAAGAIFLGAHTPTAFGDYVAGSNHVLPTGGAARFSSPLSVDTFVRRSSVVEVPPGVADELTPHLAEIARSEGFEFHRVSAELRTGSGRVG
ncbi:MAG: histidinol dehydrogenase [Thermoleophilia bacterium]